MARRKEVLPLEKVTLNLFKGDNLKLQQLHPSLGAGKVIRTLVRAHIEKVETTAAQKEERLELELPT